MTDELKVELPPLSKGSYAYSVEEIEAYTRNAIAENAERIRQLEWRVGVLAAERDHARAQYGHTFKVLMAVYNLAPHGSDIRLPDGRVMRFNDPNAAETLNALGKAIWAIPEQLASATNPTS